MFALQAMPPEYHIARHIDQRQQLSPSHTQPNIADQPLSQYLRPALSDDVISESAAVFRQVTSTGKLWMPTRKRFVQQLEAQFQYSLKERFSNQ
jgi:hypothetical protein